MTTNHLDSLSDKDARREAALIKRYGSMKKYREAAKEWGRRGGKMSKGGGFLDPEVASRAGKLGVIAMRKKIEKEIREEVINEMNQEFGELDV